jgi:hypothetical protein
MAGRVVGPMTLEQLAKNIFWGSLIVGGFTFFQKDELPPSYEMLDQLERAPLQTPTSVAPFSVRKGDITYVITPLYDYELYGLIVSDHLSSSWWDYYHEEWKDTLNFKDIGVIWGDNVKSGVYQDMVFRSESWTLYWKAKPGRDSKVGPKFKNEEGSNNHILCGDPAVARSIKKSTRGDQIFMKGYLVNYAHSHNAYTRKTSTVRTDSGCEVVFVTEFKVLKKAALFGQSLWRFSKGALLGSFLFWFCAYGVRLSRGNSRLDQEVQNV